ncbi:MAG: rhomboid family intramembrane serine protease [Chloroflexota bacterium]
MIPLSDPDIARRRYPLVNIIIIIINFLVFFYQLTLGALGSDILIYKFGFIPLELVKGINITSTTLSRGTVVNIATPIPTWMTLFTAMFIHAGWLHILGNMLYLWVFGDNIEDRFGHFQYIFFYLLSGLAATFLQTIIMPSSNIPNVGASGAIAGVLGSYLILYPRSRVRTLIFFFFISTARIPAFILLGFWFLMQIVNGIGSVGSAGAGVAYFAHIGGFLCGMGIAAIYRLSTRKLETW